MYAIYIMAKGKKAKAKKGGMNMVNRVKLSSPTGNLLKMLSTRTAGSVSGMKDYPYLYRTELR